MNQAVNTGFLLAQIINIFLIIVCFSLPIALMVMFLRNWLHLNKKEPLKRGSAPVRFEDSGNQVTAAVELVAGTYKLQYWFSAPTQVDLMGVSTGERETLFIKSGNGSAAFTLDVEGSYVFQLEPANTNAKWTIEISPLGLPGSTKVSHL